MEHFNDLLEEELLETQHYSKTIELIDGNRNIPIKMDLPELISLDKVHFGINDFYKKVNNGWSVKWKTEKYGAIGGNMQFAEIKYLFANPESFGFYDEETDEDSDIRFFHPLDYPSPESYVGFVIRPDSIYKSVYYMSISDYELYNLDLDFNGYTQMALEARVFNHWQKVLLYYMGNSETGSSETETFKTEMPKIFPDWTWENFIARFESLRLSNNT